MVSHLMICMNTVGIIKTKFRPLKTQRIMDD